MNHIFGPDGDARIPIACVAGSHGKTTVTRILHHILKQLYPSAAIADSLGIKVGDWEVATTSSDNGQSARDILANPDVTAAVFEASIESILRDGLGFDKCDIAIITNLTQVDLGGEFDLWGEEKIFAVERTPVDVVLERGAAVLNAADPLVMQMKPLSKGDVILFAVDASLDAIAQHLAEGKRAVIVAESAIWLCSGHSPHPGPAAPSTAAHAASGIDPTRDSAAEIQRLPDVAVALRLPQLPAPPGAVRGWPAPTADLPGR
ncbi:MAG: hypothetical protein B7Z55_05260 [Planctomycetales bacterium 12-60-4]|nr:MAG: hypothetical protein B7Z55_05260 [Planctomycetales bacterium 12-60-4]